MPAKPIPLRSLDPLENDPAGGTRRETPTHLPGSAAVSTKHWHLRDSLTNFRIKPSRWGVLGLRGLRRAICAGLAIENHYGLPPLYSMGTCDKLIIENPYSHPYQCSEVSVANLVRVVFPIHQSFQGMI